MNFFSSLKGTILNALKVGKKFTFDATSVTAARNFKLPDMPVDMTTGSTGDVLVKGASSIEFQTGGGGGGMTDPMTTAGDIIIRNAGNVTTRLGSSGVPGQVLTLDGSSVPSWAAGGGGGTSEAVISLAGNTTAAQGKNYAVDTTAARTITLPASPTKVDGFFFAVKDFSGQCAINKITIARAAGELIDGVAADKVLNINKGCWRFISDGTDWFTEFYSPNPNGEIVPVFYEKTSIITVADVGGSLNNKYFFMNEPAGGNGIYVWYNVNSAGVDPGPFGSRVGCVVALATGVTANTVASSTRTVIQALAAYEASVLANVISVWNAAIGAVVDATAENSGFTISILLQGGGFTNIYNGNTYLVDTLGSSPTIPTTLQLYASPANGDWFVVKDIIGFASYPNMITIARSGGEQIEGVAANKILQTNFGSWKFMAYNNNWFMMQS